MSANGTTSRARVDWVDYAKGFCIVFVVMMHSTLGVGQAAGQEGWLHTVVAFAKPFRMPDFFLISGLFLAQVIDRDWRTYLDRKVVHFAYFYVLWMTIQFAVKAPMLAQEHGALGLAWLYVESFIGAVRYALVHLPPADLLRGHQARARLRVPPPLVWLVAAALEIAHDRDRLDRDRRVREPLCLLLHRLSLGAAHLRAGNGGTGVARGRARGPRRLGRCSTALLVFNGLAVLPFVSLGSGLVGAVAVVTISALMAKSDLFKPLRYCGRNSIVIYLAFFLPMAATRTSPAQDRLDHRYRHDLRASDVCRCHRRARCCSGRCGGRRCASCSSGPSSSGSRQSRGLPCSRRSRPAAPPGPTLSRMIVPAVQANGPP